ncbi:MAG: TetR/AcrR family transcriptional regulator [Syntrophales bacterium]
MAAVSVFSQKGFKATTIADLAKKASITEATIYNHFSSKEEILLHIPFIYINDFLEECEEHLQGIRSHEEKLRKFVWLYLWWIHKNFDYMKIYVLDIRSIPHYYDTKAYELIDQISKIPTAILQSGKENGIFRVDINSVIFTNLLFGTIEWLFLAKVLFNRTMNLLDDYDIISDIIVSSVKIDARNNGGKDLEDLNKKERILIAAEELFSEKMFDETKISEIAKHANVADGTLYEYFTNKEDILFSIFEKRMREFSNSFDESIYPKQPETQLKYVIWHFLNWAQNNRQWVRIYLKDIIPNPRFYVSDKHKAMRDHDKKLKNIFLEGQKSKTFKPQINMFHFRALVFGTIDYICSPWAMLNMKDNLNSKLDSIYDLIIRAITL